MSSESSLHFELISAIGAAAEAVHLRELGDGALDALQRAVGASAALLYRYDEGGGVDALAGDLAGDMGGYEGEMIASDQPDFAEREVRALERALPAFAAAARRSARVEVEGRRHHVLDALLANAASRPLLALDTRGRLIWIAEPAERLLAPILGRRRALPEALLDAARSLGAVTAPRGGDVAAPSRFSISIPLLDGTSLRAELALARTRSGEPIIAVELESRGQRPAFADFVARHRLTRAETDVLRALARGLANQEIAAELFVSVETARTHVRRILAKLEVPTRARAAVLVRDLLG